MSIQFFKKKEFLIVLLFCGIFFVSGCATVKNNSKVSTEKEVVPVDSVEEDFFLPILAIHHVGPAPKNASADARTWYISDEKLEAILSYIKDEGYRPMFLSDVLRYLSKGQLPEKAMVLTFDDGAIDFYTHAWPILQKYHMPSMVSIMTGVRGKDWLSADQIRELHASGLVEFESHTVYHAYLTRISEQAARQELEKSKQDLEEITGAPIQVIAYPFGLYNDRVIQLAKEAGYTAGLTIHSGTNQQLDKLFELRRNIVTEQKSIEQLFAK